MIRQELIQKSPFRILEKTTHGGVGKGNIGVIAARKGVGKTACLVHMATDQLFQDKHVIHISFSSNTHHIITWYEEIFSEIAKRKNLESAMDEHDRIIKNRVVMNFNQDGIKMSQVIHSIKSLVVDGHFNADSIIIDGYDFTKGLPGDLQLLRQTGKELGLEFWFSASLKDGNDKYNSDGIPQMLSGFMNEISILISLESKNHIVYLKLVKDHDENHVADLHLKLDPKLLLITDENE